MLGNTKRLLSGPLALGLLMMMMTILPGCMTSEKGSVEAACPMLIDDARSTAEEVAKTGTPEAKKRLRLQIDRVRKICKA